MKFRLNLKPILSKISTFFYDILRDKNSKKFSITKTLALLFSVYLFSYLWYYNIIIIKEVDHTLVIELIGLILTLLGFKNGWGVGTKNETGAIIDPQINNSLAIKQTDKKNDVKEEDAVF